ncbi:MAG: alpha-glucosidase [Sphingopyxis sp.]|nr:alpha-glucosidase [Sphingopyxis sp.]
MLEFGWNGETCELRVAASGQMLFRHSAADPALSVGTGRADVVMLNGNFRMTDTVQHRHQSAALRAVAADTAELVSADNGAALLRLRIDGMRLVITALDPALNRWQLRLAAQPDEQIWGCGEQMSYLGLRGRRFPLWTSEPGVGRDKGREITRIMDEAAMAGGDYWTTNYPQPTFLSSAGYAVHVECDAYQVFDFTGDDAHLLEAWAIPAAVEFTLGDPAALVGQMSARFGRQPMLPDWAIGGAIVGLKAGDASFARLDAMRAAGVAVSALWCEDWCGIRETSFGRRLLWDWQWNSRRYSDLPARIAALKADGIGFLGYTNPYLAVDGPLYAEAKAAGYLALQLDSDAPYDVDFGEFLAGVVDFTNPAAAAWFATRIIGREMLDFGLIGWMADFGEYLPTDLRLFDGSDPLEAHNRWPVLWAKVNADALASRGMTGEAVFFMRAGWTGVGAHCPLHWAGDQLVDFSRHDGIGTAITGALSAGLVGNAWHHADCGGYTSLHGIVRTAELLHRWFDFCAFTPVLRTHEGNRPDDNLQVDSTPELLAHFALMTRLHAALAPYVRAAGVAAGATGLPLMRALFLHYPDDRETWTLQDQYLYGRDLMVAPAVTEGASARDVYLPGDDWVDFYSGAAVAAGWHSVAAPNGKPPVFVRAAAPMLGDLLAIGRTHAAAAEALA